jgi:hypothetical protein
VILPRLELTRLECLAVSSVGPLFIGQYYYYLRLIVLGAGRGVPEASCRPDSNYSTL